MISKLIRRTHMYLALFLTPWMLMYALSTMAMQHRDWFSAEGQPVEYVRERTTTYDGGFAPNAAPKEMGEQLLTHLEMRGQFQAKQLDDGKLEVVRFNPVQNRRLTFNPSDKSVVIEAAVVSTQRSLEALHRLRGYQSGFASRTAWAVVVDLVIAGIVFWCLSGLWLWWQLKTTRRLGALCASAGLLCFVVFLAKI